MPVINPTATALLAAIIEFLDEDTPRLVFADYLQENGDDDRAEFIRLQIQLHVNRGLNGKNFSRMNNLERAHRERWLYVMCPKCEGTGGHHVPGSGENIYCTTCDATGDLGGLWHAPVNTGYRNADHNRRFSRGFIDEIRQCRLQDLLEQPTIKTGRSSVGLGSWQPTPWAIRVLTHHPTITRIPLSGVQFSEIWGYVALYENGLHGLPAPVFNRLWDTSEESGRGERDNVKWVNWTTREAANLAIALAVVDVIRNHIATRKT